MQGPPKYPQYGNAMPPQPAQQYAGYQPYQPVPAPGQQQQGYVPTSQPFVPAPPSSYAAAQPYSPQRQQYAGGHDHQQYAMPSYAPAAGARGPAPQMQMPNIPGTGGGGFMSNLSPFGLMSGGLLSAPQHYMQQRMGWLKSNMTTGTMSALFCIDNTYVRNKLLMLLAPFLKRWTYTRAHEQIAGGHKYRPPRADVNAPDLYIPLMAMWTYALLACAMSALQHRFTPDIMSSRVYGAGLAWAAHWAVARLLLRGMNVGGVAWSELLAYTGYPFVPVCIAILLGFLAGRLAYYVAWAYGSMAMGIFMVRSMKRIMFQEARAYGHDLKLTNYLLLGLAAFQFPFAFWLGIRPAK